MKAVGPAAPAAVGLPFLWRRFRATLVPRAGAATTVPFDREALLRSPGVTWIGHATLLVRMDGAGFLTDPVFSERASPLSFAGPRRLVPPGVPLGELPPLAFALLSHDHYDHADLPSIKALAARGLRFIVPRGVAELVRRMGGEAVELGWWDSVVIGALRVTCVPAQHFSGRSLTDRNGPTRRFYFAGDTAYFPAFAEIGRRLGPLHLAAVPIGAYSPREMMSPVHTTPEEGLQAALDAGAERVLGMHFGTFDLADEPLDEPPRRFLAEAARRELGDRAFVLKVGETRDF